MRGLPAGGYPPTGLQNLLLNLYSLVKEHSTPTRRSSRKRPDRFEAGQALIVNSRKAVHEQSLLVFTLSGTRPC